MESLAFIVDVNSSAVHMMSSGIIDKYPVRA